MDEVNARVQPQSSICSDSNGEENVANEVSRASQHRICLIGNLAQNPSVREAADTFRVPVAQSDTGMEFAQDDDVYSTIFVLENFEGDVYNYLSKRKQCLLGPLALRQLAEKGQPLPDNTRPLYNLSMMGVVLCFTGFRSKDELAVMVPLIHRMGGSIRKNITEKVTHLISNVCTGDKYQYAALFRVPVMSPQWVYASWEKRHEFSFSATVDVFVSDYKLKPFHGAKVCFAGFAVDEEKHMTDVLLSNGGALATIEDPHCTHVVMERAEVYTLESAAAPLSPALIKTPTPNPIDDNHYNKILSNLNEKSSDNEINTSHFDQSLTLMSTPNSVANRKRKSSPSEEQFSKRRRDKCVSERKRKISGIFKTPINYFSQRRRTVDASTLNQSVVSSSGVFNVDVVEDLSVCNNEELLTPQSARKKIRKSLFTRTFSSTKFARSKNRKREQRDLNATILSFQDNSDDDNERNEQLNATCFPNISLNPITNSELRSGCTRDTHGPTAPAISVVDESTVNEKPEVVSKVFVVKAEWFWTSVQKEVCLDEKDYLYDDYVEQVFSPAGRRDSHQATPSSGSRRKRKRFHEGLLSSLAHQQSPGLHKRRSSVSDAGLLSVSGFSLDCTVSPDKVLDGVEPVIDTPRKGLTTRHQVFLEMFQTECNYVDILDTIVNKFKKDLEDMSEEDALLNNTEVNLIFGKIPAIYEAHLKIRNEMRTFVTSWSEDNLIGSIIVKYSKDLLKSYPAYINYFEEMKEMLTKCDQTKPRFHAFLKAYQTKPECGRQTLQELMIRPVQRLGSMCLLLANLLKHTPKTNPDHGEIEKALDMLKQSMDSINEHKRKAEAQITLFTIFNEIENCPPDILCSHRQFIAKADVIQVSTTEGLSSKGNSLILFVFSDQVEVCKKKSKGFNNPKSPGTTGSLQKNTNKPYKHVKLIPLNTIKKVVDIKETEQCQKVFCFVCRSNDELKEKVYSFAMADEEADKAAFLKTLTEQMANNACTPADKFLAGLEAHQLDIDTSDVSNGTLSKAFKFATRTRLKVGRAFSFNKTPSKLKRAVSSMMSPFGSSNNLTPSTELSQMRLASYNHINELGSAENASESPPLAPMSVQPTRKMKTSSLNVNALKRI